MTGAAIVALVAMLGGQQGGAGGGGFGGGGMSGKFFSDGAEGELQTYNHILTPGDRGEWPIAAKKGDVVIIKASSDVFDAALEIVDEKDKVIAQNDDIEDGNQAAQVLVQFPVDGKYRALVKGYKSAAGGKYTMEIRRLKSLNMDFEKPFLANFPAKGSLVLRIPEGKGGTVAFSVYTDDYPNISLIRANGAREKLEVERGLHSLQTKFESSKEGASYIWFESYYRDLPFKAIAAVSKPAPLKVSSEGSKSVLRTGHLELWEISLKKGETVEVPKLPKNLRMGMKEAMSESDDKSGTPALIKLAAEKHTDKYFAARDSKTIFSVMSFEENDIPYTMVVKPAARLWPGGDKISDSIGIGESRLYSVSAKMGDIIKFNGSAKAFDMVIEIHDFTGNSVSLSDDIDNFDPGMTFFVGKTGVYTVVVRSLGNGGGGAFTLTKEVIPVVALPQNKWANSEVKEGSPSRWHISLKKGELYMVRVKTNNFKPTFAINLPDGEYFSFDGMVIGDKQAFATFIAPSDGEFTVTVASDEGFGKYEIKWNVVGD